METDTSLISTFQKATEDAFAATVNYAPSLLGALLALLLGWLLARFVRGIARRVLGGTNRLLDRLLRRGTLSEARISSSTAVFLSEILFWVVIFIAITVAAQIAELPALSEWLSQIVGHLPNLVIGAIIIAVGYYISVVIGEQVTSSAEAAKAGQSALIGRFAQSAIFVTAVIIGLDQIGVDVTFLVALFAVAMGAIFVGFSIAFGLGARDYVSNLIGARTVRQLLKPGVKLRIGDIEGEVLEISPTQIALDTADGRTLVPARFADERGLIIISSDTSGGTGNE